MPNLRKAEKDKTSAYRRMVTLTPPTAKRVQELARKGPTSISATLRRLVEIGLKVSE